MRVYLESNFILELAFRREEYESCLALLNLARSQTLQLTLPAFTIGEPYEALVRRAKQRNDLQKRLVIEIKELSRSKTYQEKLTDFLELTDLLLSSDQDERRSLDQTLEDILAVAEVIPINLQVVQSSIAVRQKIAFSPQDSLVYASILAHLSEHQPEVSCFITKNSRDFADNNIRQPLSDHGCQILWRFEDGLGYARHRGTRAAK